MAWEFKYTLGTNELSRKEHHLWQALVAEFFGNFVLNFFACGACTQPEDGTFKALAFGLAVFIAITIVGHVSGGHINPAVTCGMLVAGRISFIRTLFYIAFQCLGATAGTLSVKALLDESYYNGLGHTSLAENITSLQGLGIEFFLGLLLVLTVFGAIDTNKPTSHYTAPLAIGLSVTLGHLGAIKYTGASMNPARTFGTAVVVGNFSNHWVYWAGPILGGITAALLYCIVLEAEPAPTPVDRYNTRADDREMRKLDSREV